MNAHPHEISSEILLINTPTTHSFSTKYSGDMRNISDRRIFLDKTRLTELCYIPHQVHGDVIVEIDSGDGSQPQDADGVILRKDSGAIQSIGILTADCVPILFADRSGRFVAAVHAGWKGTAKNISEKMIEKLSSSGVLKHDIYVAIGPHIHSCCYSVSLERASLFMSQVRENHEIVIHSEEGVWAIELGKMNAMQLEHAGIQSDHIDMNPYCTSCQSDLFFSYRRENGVLSGEMLAAISFN